MKKSKPNLKERQQKFCEYAAQGDSAYQACIKAGYSQKYAKSDSYKLLERYGNEIDKLKPKVQKVIEKKFNYSVEKSFNKLCEIQKLALQPDDKGNYSNLSVATKVEELKGKMYGVYEADNKQKVSEPVNIVIDRNIVKNVINDIDNLADE